MASIEYSLFRCKLIRPRQFRLRGIGDDESTPSQLFLRAINAKPSGELRVGYTWHIGNVLPFDDTTGYFAVGRTTSSTVSKFDEQTQNFVEEELVASPYTHCVYDAAIGLLGIAKNTRIGQTAQSVARKLQRLLELTDTVAENDITVEVQPISDPDGFLKALRGAYRVFRFTATFRGPNPFDADEYFQKPLSVYLSAAKGTNGRAQIDGDNLDRDVLEEVARSTAATGNHASARIVRHKSHKPLTISLEGDPIKRKYDEVDHDPKVVLADLDKVYKRVRTDAGD